MTKGGGGWVGFRAITSTGTCTLYEVSDRHIPFRSDIEVDGLTE